MTHEEITIVNELAGNTILEALSLLIINESKTTLRQLIAEGEIELNDSRVSTGATVNVGDRIKVPDGLDLGAPPQQCMELDVLREDEDHLVFNKPPGVPVLPGRDGGQREFYDSLMAYVNRDTPPGGPYVRPHLVHRLDKDTSGVLVVARNTAASRFLSLQFQNREVEKIYEGLAEGVLPRDEVTVNIPLGRSSESILAMVPKGRKGKPAETKITVARRFGHFSLVRLEPHTGRQHQLRVHLAAIGYPLVVDFLYGRREQLTGKDLNEILRRRVTHPDTVLLDRCPLHARSLTYQPPGTDERQRVEAPLPSDFQGVIRELSNLDPVGE